MDDDDDDDDVGDDDDEDDDDEDDEEDEDDDEDDDDERKTDGRPGTDTIGRRPPPFATILTADDASPSPSPCTRHCVSLNRSTAAATCALACRRTVSASRSNSTRRRSVAAN